MSTLLRICPGDAWGLLIANVLVQVTVVIFMARLAARLAGRWNAAGRYSIYLAALVCVLASPVLSWVMQASGITLVALRAPGPAAQLAEPTHAAMAPTPEPEPVNIPAPPESAANAALPPPDNLKQDLRPLNPPAPAGADILRAAGAGAVVIWLSGMALLCVRWCHGLHLLAALRRAARPLDCGPMAELLGQVRQALGVDRLPPLACSAGLDRPVMVGLVRPLVILPENALRTLHEPDLGDVLVHECAHAVCRHQVVGLLQRVAGILLWPHPLVRLLNRELARAREEVCDNYVLRRSAAPRYARTLLELSQSLVGVSPKPAALGLFPCHWRLEDRVADLLDRRRRVMTGVNRWTAAALTAAFLSLALLVAGTSIVQAATIERRAVHKLIKDFPEKTDLSTPESAMAACARSSARNDFQAVLEMSWVKLDTQLAKEIEYGLMHDPNVRRDIGPLFLQIEIIEVLTYHDDLAAVICKGGLPGEGPYGAMPMGKINGVWKILSLFPLDDSDRKLTARSARGAAEGFEKVKDDLWRTFVGVRNEVKAGRTVVYDAKRLAASGAPAKCRVVHKLVKDFPERTDLSTPESAMAACARSLARNDFRAVIEISWVKLDAQKAEFIEHCLTYDPTMPKNHGPLYLDDEIIEVLTYHDDLATVICKGSLPGETPYRTTPMGKINGVWKILSLYPLDVSDRNLTARSAQGAVESFEKDKDALWRRFVEIRNDVRNGRTPVSKFNSKSPPGSLSAAETPVLSAAEKEEMERSEREAWQMSIHLDMPSLEPQAVQFAIRDNDPVPDFMAMAKRMQSYSRQQLRQAGNEARKEQLRGIEMAVWWNLGFKKVTGDGVHLLTNLSESRFAESRHGIMSNSPGGRKWVVTKTVYIEGKPVCWCIPVVVTTGKKIDVTFNNSNTFDLRAVYDNAMWEPAGVGAR